MIPVTCKTHMKTLKLLTAWLFAVAGPFATTAIAQTTSTGSGPAYPTKTIRIFAPFPPASVADVLTRPIAQ
jgi:tripartite-type tricarboxylate transporter receptor subunit TctC